MKTLLAAAVVALFGAAPAASPAPAAAETAVTVSFLEPAGRIKIGEQKVPLALDGKAHQTALTLGGSLAGFSVKEVSRDVKVNGQAPGVWCELTILGKDGAEAGYLAVTFPAEPSPVVSAATKFKGAKGAPIVAVVTR